MTCFLVEYHNGMRKEELLKYLFSWVLVLIWIYRETLSEVLPISKADSAAESNCSTGYGQNKLFLPQYIAVVLYVFGRKQKLYRWNNHISIQIVNKGMVATREVKSLLTQWRVQYWNIHGLIKLVINWCFIFHSGAPNSPCSILKWNTEYMDVLASSTSNYF